MKMRSAMTAFRASLESADENLATEVVLAGGEDSMENGLLEVQEAAQEVADNESAVDELTEVAEGLEEIADAVETAAEDGGLNPQAAEMLALGVESYTRRLGIESRVIPSLESFGGASNRQQATRVSLEGLRETIENVWNAIKAQIQKLITWVRDYYQRVWAAAPKIRKRAEDLLAKVDGLDGKTAKDKTVEAGGIVKALHLGGKFPADLGAEVKRVSASVKTALAGSNTEYTANAELIATGVEGVSADNSEKLIEGLKKFLGDSTLLADTTSIGATNGPDAGDDRFGNDVDVKRSAELPGGVAIFASSRKAAQLNEKALGADHVSSISIKVMPFSKKAPDVKAEMPVLDIATMRAVCNGVVELTTEIENFKRDFEKADKAKAKIVKAGDKFSDSIKRSKELSADAKTAANATMKMLQALPRLTTAASDCAVSVGLGTSKAALAAVEKSLGNYSSK